MQRRSSSYSGAGHQTAAPEALPLTSTADPTSTSTSHVNSSSVPPYSSYPSHQGQQSSIPDPNAAMSLPETIPQPGWHEGASVNATHGHENGLQPPPDAPSGFYRRSKACIACRGQKVCRLALSYSCSLGSVTHDGLVRSNASWIGAMLLAGDASGKSYLALSTSKA